MGDEISEVLRFSLFMLKSFGFKEIRAYLSTMPEKCVGEPERWEAATESLRKAVEAEGLEYDVDEGGGAFYGPKIDLKVKDTMGREWQLSTIQFDFNLPDRFDLVFVDKDGQEKRPYMVHRALLGSLERFFGVLIENYGGAFPVWLCPEQARIIPITDDQLDYAEDVKKQLVQAGISAACDISDNRMNAKIRTAQMEKIPYMLVIGGQEMENGTVSIRVRTGDKMDPLSVEDAISFIRQKIDNRELP
jgi:threonyl-tRNA synthetase